MPIFHQCSIAVCDVSWTVVMMIVELFGVNETWKEVCVVNRRQGFLPTTEKRCHL